VDAQLIRLLLAQLPTRLFHSKPPPILYKYFAPERIDVLQNRKIRFTQPPVFNDPFESFPAFSQFMRPTDLEQALRLQPNLTEETRHAMLKESVIGPIGRLIAPVILDTFARCHGVLSLTEKYDNLLMWAHYARSHEGFVVGFKTSEPFLNWRSPSRAHSDIMLRKVRYSRRRPTVKFLTETGLIFFYFTKSKEWAYEQEWRMFTAMVAEEVAPWLESALTSIAESRTVPATPEYPICLFDFPPSSVSRVILGCRASAETCRAVRLVVSAKYPKAELLKVERDESKFCLTVGPFAHEQRRN